MDGNVTGLAGVILWTSADRFEAMVRFYRDILGLEAHHQRPGSVNFAWEKTRLTVAVHSRVIGPSRDALRVMVNLAVDDIVAAHRRLTIAGVSFLRPPEQEEWGGWVATFSDPDGNTVQLLQLPT